MLQTMYVSNGADAEPPIKFLPPDSSILGLIVIDNVAYAETTPGCQGAPNGVWALDLVSKKASNWTTNAAATSGTAGVAFGPDGTLYWTAGFTFTALEPKSLKPKAPFLTVKQEFTSSPAVFRFDDRILVAAATRDGGIHLFDAEKMVEVGHEAMAGNADFVPGALATWQDAAGTRWILASAASAIMAWKVVAQNGVPALQPGWVSRDMVSPLTPIIVNGVVFAVSSGEFRTNDSRVTAAERVQRSVPAVLYALDAATGKEFWNSGKAIASFVHSGGLSAGGSQIYLGTYDGTLYAFGFPMEH
jgi:outer membrane protein assembly factor BamB